MAHSHENVRFVTAPAAPSPPLVFGPVCRSLLSSLVVASGDAEGGGDACPRRTCKRIIRFFVLAVHP